MVPGPQCHGSVMSQNKIGSGWQTKDAHPMAARQERWNLCQQPIVPKGLLRWTKFSQLDPSFYHLSIAHQVMNPSVD